MRTCIFLLLLFNFNLTVYGQTAASISFLGTGRILRCSGSIFSFPDANQDHQALFLTNGHCSQEGNYKRRHPRQPFDFIKSLLGATEVIKNRVRQRSVVLNNQFDKEVTIKTTMLLLATMYKKDVAVYELESSYKELRQEYGIIPFVLTPSDELEAEFTQLQLISGYWFDHYLCRFDGFVAKVNEYKFMWSNLLRVFGDCADTRGGNSGSPLLIAGTRKLVGIHNSRYHGGTPCTLFNPCEADENGAPLIYEEGAYGQTLDQFFNCRDEDGRFDATVAECSF